jgi:hypothetical protein
VKVRRLFALAHIGRRNGEEPNAQMINR